MEFIIANSNMEEIGFLTPFSNIDIDLGQETDFRLELELGDYDPELYSPGNMIFATGTEYGGFLADPEVDTAQNTITFTGDTFRGLLKKKIIEPPKNAAHRVISGELNSCISKLLKMHFTSLFTVADIATSVSVSNFQFDRYCTLYDGIVTMLASVNYKLKIEVQNAAGEIKIILEAVPIFDYSQSVEFSQDGNVDFKIKNQTAIYEYLIALGGGELENRTVKYFKYNTDSTVEEVTAIPTGNFTRVYLYDYSSVGSDDELVDSATKKLKEINSGNAQSITLNNDAEGLELGDIVGGRDYITGLTVKAPVTNKIINIKNRIVSISYTVEGDEN